MERKFTCKTPSNFVSEITMCTCMITIWSKFQHGRSSWQNNANCGGLHETTFGLRRNFSNRTLALVKTNCCVCSQKKCGVNRNHIRLPFRQVGLPGSCCQILWIFTISNFMIKRKCKEPSPLLVGFLKPCYCHAFHALCQMKRCKLGIWFWPVSCNSVASMFCRFLREKFLKTVATM